MPFQNLTINDWIWGDGFVGRGLVAQAWELKFKPLEPTYELSALVTMACICNNSQMGDRDKKSLEARGSAILVYAAVNKETLPNIQNKVDAKDQHLR